MPYRIFVDSAGGEWQVWDIVPRHSERRHGGADRRLEAQNIEFIDRRQANRRLIETRRALLRGPYAHGWLCFDNDKEKRRLSPIPSDWPTCSDAVLEDYLREGEPVLGAHSVFTFADDGRGPLAEAG